MSTPLEIEGRLRTEFPTGIPVQVGGVRSVLTGEVYEARIAEMVAAALAQEASDAAAAAAKQRRQAIRARYDALKAGTATSAITQDTLARAIRELWAEGE